MTGLRSSSASSGTSTASRPRAVMSECSPATSPAGAPRKPCRIREMRSESNGPCPLCLRHRRHQEGPVVPHVGGHTARRDHDQRPHRRVADQTQRHLGPGSHGLHQHLRWRGRARRGSHGRRRGPAPAVRSPVRTSPSSVLWTTPGSVDLHGDRETDGLGGPDGGRCRVGRVAQRVEVRTPPAVESCRRHPASGCPRPPAGRERRVVQRPPHPGWSRAARRRPRPATRRTRTARPRARKAEAVVRYVVIGCSLAGASGSPPRGTASTGTPG